MDNTEYKILIIDDEPNNIEAIVNCLQEYFYKISVAVDVQSGYDIAIKIFPNLIITDWEMPGLSGIEGIKMFKNNRYLKDIPIIMATGKMTSSENLKTALDAGAVDYIRKPIDKIELSARVYSMLKLHDSIKKNIEQEKFIREEKEQQLIETISKNKRELASATIQLIRTGEVNKQLISDLKNLSGCSEKERTKINNIISGLKVNSLQINSKEFEIIFEQVHPDFYKSLNKRYPELTSSERRLCSFLRLNMSSKEIATITLQTDAALKKARFRLRKKIMSGKSESISSYLQQF